jgi:acyl-homoserine-lactone acylase
MTASLRRLWIGAVLGLVCPAGGERSQAAEAEALAEQVQIHRTRYGVPHIEAPTLEGVSFGFAYCQAEDHLENILRGILGARGELSKTFGPGDGDRNVAADLYARQFRIHARAVEGYPRLDPDYRACCDGFAAGLNYFVRRNPKSSPPWSPSVTPQDVAAYGVAGVMRFAFNRGGLLRDFLRSQGEAACIFDDPPPDLLYGSNMWALAPSRTSSGRAILMGNPHQPWSPVATYYEAHLIVPGRMNFYGATFIGRPILTSGWNERLGWSHTVNYPDLEEIYALDLDPERPDHYMFDGGSVPLRREDVEIEVRSDAGPRTVAATYWHAPLGPVVHRDARRVYVLRGAGYENDRAYAQWLRMTQARNYAEFRAALEWNAIPMFNICYADREGNIFYIWNGTVPRLPHPAHHAEAVHAAKTSDVWTEFHETRELPQLFNPPGGYVQNCNSPPYLTNLSAPLDPAAYPPYFGPNNLSLRTQHCLELLHNDRRFSLEDVCAMKHSPRMLGAERVKADLIDAARRATRDPRLDEAVAALESWDDSVAAACRGATLFAAWWERYFQRGKGKFAVEWSEAEPTTTPRGLADKELAARALREAADEVARRYGRVDPAWGEVHRIRKGDVDLPVSGGSGWMGCFRVLEFRDEADGRRAANSGDSWVFAVEFGDAPRAFTVVAYSGSDVAGSPHYNDQAALFSANRLKPAAFTQAEIQADLVRSYRPCEAPEPTRRRPPPSDSP